MLSSPEHMAHMHHTEADTARQAASLLLGCFRWFVLASLSLAAAFKLFTVLWISHSSAPFLASPEPVLAFLFGVPVSLGAVMLLEALGEAIVVGLLLRSDLRTQMAITAFVSTLFLLYHLLLAQIGYHGPCPCFGDVYRYLGLSVPTVNAITLCVALVMGIGSYGWFMVEWLKQRSSVPGQRT